MRARLAAGLVASLLLAISAAHAQDVTTVTHCPDGTVPPVSFRIDCTNVTNPESKARCATFIENQACRVFFAYRKITDIRLEDRCPELVYRIYDQDRFPQRGGDAGGLAGHCSVDYMAQYSVDTRTDSPIGPYDTHELLHEYQDNMGALPYAHILFGPSQAEAMRLVGDTKGYEEALTRMKQESSQWEALFAKRAANAGGHDPCVSAEVQMETTLYLENPQNVYLFYRKLQRSMQKDQADREARFNRMYNTVSNGRARDFLLAHGCAPF